MAVGAAAVVWFACTVRARPECSTISHDEARNIGRGIANLGTLGIGEPYWLAASDGAIFSSARRVAPTSKSSIFATVDGA